LAPDVVVQFAVAFPDPVAVYAFDVHHCVVFLVVFQAVVADSGVASHVAPPVLLAEVAGFLFAPHPSEYGVAVVESVAAACYGGAVVVVVPLAEFLCLAGVAHSVVVVSPAVVVEFDVVPHYCKDVVVIASLAAGVDLSNSVHLAEHAAVVVLFLGVFAEFPVVARHDEDAVVDVHLEDVVADLLHAAVAALVAVAHCGEDFVVVGVALAPDFEVVDVVSYPAVVGPVAAPPLWVAVVAILALVVVVAVHSLFPVAYPLVFHLSVVPSSFLIV
jgi:hypothetical protein